MSYTPTNWVNGDTITATKMNKIEQGIADAGSGGGGGGAFIVNDVEGTLDKTWQEIWDSAETGIVMIKYSTETEIDYYLVAMVNTDGESYWGLRTNTDDFYEASSASSYPVLSGM